MATVRIAMTGNRTGILAICFSLAMVALASERAFADGSSGHYLATVANLESRRSATCVEMRCSTRVCAQRTTTRRLAGATICRTREDTQTRIPMMESASAVATNCHSRTPPENAVQSREVHRASVATICRTRKAVSPPRLRRSAAVAGSS